MGVSNTQISTYSNVANKRIHNGFSASYSTTATKCVTKGELKKVEFLEAKDRTTTSYITYGANTAFGSGSHSTLTVNATSSNVYNNPITYTNIYYETSTYDYSTTAYCSLRMPTTISAYTTVTVGLTSQWPSLISDSGKLAIFAKQVTGISTGLVDLKFTITAEGLYGSSSTSPAGVGGQTPAVVSNAVLTYGVIVTDSNGQLIAQRTPTPVYTASLTDNFTFSTSTSTINVYIIILSLTFQFTAGQASYCAGFKLKAASEVKSYASRYDLDTKCVQYQDINHPSGKTFTIYYGVWNNKGSNARLNNLYVQIKKTTETSWTTIGTATLPSSLNSTTTGSVTCTLPTSYDPKVQYDFRVTAGETNSNQEWWYRWGSQSTLSNSGYSWTKYSGSAKTGVCPNEHGLNTHSSYSTLRNHAWSTTTLARGRSTGQAALFCIE